MSDERLADFRADVSLSTEATDAVPTRVVVGESQVVLATEDARECIALQDVFDVAQDVPAAADPDTPSTVTLGFERGESRETATIECRAGTLAKFQLVVFKLLLDGTSVTVKQGSDGDQSDEESRSGTLEIRADRIGFDCESRTIRVARDDVIGFETSQTAGDSGADQPTIALFSTVGGRQVKTLVRVGSFRQLNLLGRFLQSSPDAGRESSREETVSTVSVLVVDDDPGDLETIAVMLERLDDRITVTSVTSAPGGLERLERDSFDCVVSDYGMPGMDGIEFLNAVRERDPDLPFVLFTGQGSKAVAKQAILGDATDYVEKGIGSEQYEILASRVLKAVR